MPTAHTIKKNESLSTIARLYKIGDWKSIWMDPGNSALRQARKVPEGIRPGDRLVIPEPSPRRATVGGTVGMAAQGFTLLCFSPREAQAAPFSGLKVKLSLYKKESSVLLTPTVPPWRNWENSLLRPTLGQMEGLADAKGIVRLNLRFSPAGEFGIDRIWDDSQSPPITYFNAAWSRRVEEGPRPWQHLAVHQQHVLTLPNKRRYAELGALRKEFGLKAPAK